jgi:hypothetical protein
MQAQSPVHRSISSRCAYLAAIKTDRTGTRRNSLRYPRIQQAEEASMDGIIYLVGLIVIIMFILSFFGLR